MRQLGPDRPEVGEERLVSVVIMSRRPRFRRCRLVPIVRCAIFTWRIAPLHDPLVEIHHPLAEIGQRGTVPIDIESAVRGSGKGSTRGVTFRSRSWRGTGTPFGLGD